MLLYTVILLIAVVNAQLIYDRNSQDAFKLCIEEFTTSSSLKERECQSYLSSEACLKKAGLSERQAFKYMANERARHPELPLRCSSSTSVGFVWLIVACVALWGFSQLAGQDSMTEREWFKVIEETSDEEDEEDNVRREGTPAKQKRAAFEPNKHLVETLQKYYQTLVAYKTSDGRELADAFIQLLPRRELPDYYEVIEKPMDLNRMKKKIKDGKYGSLEEMSADVRLMCRNAQTYNEDGSDIFNDSVLLERVWERILEAHNAPNIALTSARATPPTQTIGDKAAMESEESNDES